MLLKKHAKIIEFITKFITKLLENSPTYTGNLQLNFFNGTLANIVKNQSYKMPKEETI